MKQKNDALAAVGWLFADVLLGLAIIFLGSASQVDEFLLKQSDPSGPSTSSSVPTATTTTTVAPATTLAPIEGLDPEPFILEVPNLNLGALADVGSARREAEADRIEALVRDQLGDRIDAQTRVGIALTFGVDPDVGDGQKLAVALNTVLQERLPELFDGTALRSFDFRASAGQGAARSELYFFVRG